jgi:hypothetical protein
MDFLRLIKSLDDFLFEIVGWIVFYPITLFRAICHPVAMLHYSDRELAGPEDTQYDDTLNPPIFLLVTLCLVYVLGRTLQPELKAVLPGFLASDANLLIFRGVAFSIFPVLMAVDLLRHQHRRIDRTTLRPHFYGQCFLASPFALVASIAGQLVEFHRLPYVLGGLALYLLAFAWYVAAEVTWFSLTLNISKLRATGNVLGVVVFTNLLVFAIALAISFLGKHG